MEKYQVLGLVGEGSYGVVTKCRNRETGQIVAVKKFLESEEDAAVRKIAAREVKLLKVECIEAFLIRSVLEWEYVQAYPLSSQVCQTVVPVLRRKKTDLYHHCKSYRPCELIEMGLTGKSPNNFIRKITIQMLSRWQLDRTQQLRHENLVNLLEVCKKKKRWYLVFEFVDHTVLDDLEAFPNGLDYSRVRKYLFQIIRGIAFCHSHNIIHRDIKPENILVSQSGVVKLCDFGFARTLAASGEAYTDYVATRWYRAPELLVGDIKYGKAVDVWAIGSLITEMLTGEPLFPGDSDIDQLYHITKCLGNLIPRHQELFYKNPLFAGMRLPEVKEAESLDKRYPKLPAAVLDLAKNCLQIDPDKRPSCAELLQCDFFHKDGFAERFAQELKLKIQKDARDHQLQKKSKISKRDKDDALEERKMLNVQDFSIDPKSRDTKLLKAKRSKADAEKADRSSNLSSFYDSPINPFKISPQTSLKDSSSNLDYTKNTGIVIPPINQNLSPTLAGMGKHNYRIDDKSKKYLNPFLKQRKRSPAGHYGVSLTPVTNEKNILQANRKKWEFSKTDVRLPELNHLPELRGAEAWHPRFLKKENKLVSESRVPSLAAIDLHNPSRASQQLSGPLPDASESGFPRVEH